MTTMQEYSRLAQSQSSELLSRPGDLDLVLLISEIEALSGCIQFVADHVWAFMRLYRSLEAIHNNVPESIRLTLTEYMRLYNKHNIPLFNFGFNFRCNTLQHQKFNIIVYLEGHKMITPFIMRYANRKSEKRFWRWCSVYNEIAHVFAGIKNSLDQKTPCWF